MASGERGQARVERADRSRFAGSRRCEDPGDRTRRAVGGQELVAAEQGPERHPGESGSQPAASRVSRPDQPGRQRVQDHRSRQAGQRTGPGQQSAEAFAEPPDEDRPADRNPECELDRPPVKQAGRDQELDQREPGVRQGQMPSGQVRRPDDRPGDQPGVTGRGRVDGPADELPREHVRLELEQRVHQPDCPEGELQSTPARPRQTSPRRARHRDRVQPRLDLDHLAPPGVRRSTGGGKQPQSFPPKGCKEGSRPSPGRSGSEDGRPAGRVRRSGRAADGTRSSACRWTGSCCCCPGEG